MSATPDDTVAEQITQDLVEQGLIPAELARTFQHKLLTGELKADDWLAFAQVAGRDQP
jgi:hypothetical protein